MKYGHAAVEPHIRKALVERKDLFSLYFTSETVTFKDNNNKEFQQTLVYCSEICDFIEELAMLRNQSVGQLCDKIGLDCGQGHLRMTLTLYDPETVTHSEANQSRTCRSQGIGVGVNYRETGVKKVMILASSPKVPENFFNAGIFIEKVKLDQLHYKFTGDFKMLNIISGLMSASAKCLL